MTQVKNESAPLVEVRGLKKYFKTPYGMLHAVDDVYLSIEKGKTLGIVGESGCGKTTLGRVTLRLLEATAGQVLYKGENILDYDKTRMAELKKSMQLIFQDPYASLDPRMSVRELIAEPLRIAKAYSAKSRLYERVEELMDSVGLDHRFAESYAHEMDGGRRQRTGIARALALDPEFIVCDEPVSSLDVSIQAQILNLMMDLQEQRGLTYMFITHDLSVVRYISSEIAVMYLGQCVERAPSKELFKNPRHPYTIGLLNAIPVPSLRGKKLSHQPMSGELTSPVAPEPGCRFAPRCPKACPRCKGADPQLSEIESGHFVACGELSR